MWGMGELYTDQCDLHVKRGGRKTQICGTLCGGHGGRVLGMGLWIEG